MRRILSLVLVTVMLLSTFMLTSCDFEKTWNDVSGFVGGLIDKYISGSRTTIDKSEWENLYNSTNYTVSQNSPGYYYFIEVADTKARIVAEVDDYKQSMVYDFEGGCILSETNAGWVGSKSEYMPDMENITLGETVGLYEIEFEDLVYDEATKTYVWEDGTHTVFKFQFNNGVLSYAIAESEYMDMKETVEIKNVGTTVIDIPSYVILNDGVVDPNNAAEGVETTVTTEQLAALLDNRNFTLNGVVSYDGYSVELGIKFADTTIGIEVSAYGQTLGTYLTLIDGEFYVVKQDSYADWYATPVGGTMDDFNAGVEEAKNYISVDYLTYDEEGRYYKMALDAVVAEYIGADSAELYIYFENGMFTKAVCVFEVVYSSPYEKDRIEYIEVLVLLNDLGTTSIELPEYTLLDENGDIVFVD